VAKALHDVLVLTSSTGMAATRKAASAAPARKAPRPIRRPGVPCKATVASTRWRNILAAGLHK